MKNLSITLILLSSLMFGTNAYAKTIKRTTTTVKSKRTVKNIRPNRKVVKVRTVVTPKKKWKKSKRVKNHKRYKHTKRHQTHKWGRSKHVHHRPHHIIGRRYTSLPRSAVRIVRKGHIEFYAEDAFFRPVYRRGRTHFVVVF